MAEIRMRDHAEEAFTPAHRREPRRVETRRAEAHKGDVASAFFAEHLDLDAIRRALGQPAVPAPGDRAEGRAREHPVGPKPPGEEPSREEPSREEPSGGEPATEMAGAEMVGEDPARGRADGARGMAPGTPADTTPGAAAEGPPLGRDLSRPPPSPRPDAALAAPPREPGPRSRRMAVLAPALAGGLAAVAVSLAIGVPGIAVRTGEDPSQSSPPSALAEAAPLPVAATTIGSAPTLPAPGAAALTPRLAPAPVGSAGPPSPVPPSLVGSIPARAVAAPTPVPEKPAAGAPMAGAPVAWAASAPPPRITARLGDMPARAGMTARLPDLAPIRFAPPPDQPAGTPGTPDRPSAAHAAALPLLARGAVEASPAPPIGPLSIAPRPLPPEPRPMRTAEPSPPSPPPPSTSRAVVHLRGAPGEPFRARLTETLRRAGFERVEWRAVAGTVSRTQTRHFHASDARAAERAAAALTAQGRPASPRDFTHYDPPASPGTVEIWLSD